METVAASSSVVYGGRLRSVPSGFYARFGKLLHFHWRRLLRVRATPHEIALGCAAGIFAACTPFLGFQMVLAFALAALLRVSVPAALAATFVGNPLSWPAIWSASYIAGIWMLGYDPTLAAAALAESATVLGGPLVGSGQQAAATTMFKLSPFWEAMALGGIAIGLLAAAGSYYPMRRAVRVFQKRRRST